MKSGRKKIICKRCNKSKLHFGLGFCSSCLRHHKRQTRPSFYLGTCYSEMSRRCKTFDPLRPRYKGLSICSREEFIDKFVNNKQFIKLFKNWQKNGFKRKYAPSIDRIDNNLGYTLENLQFIQQNQNGKKDWQYNIKVSYKDEEYYFDSQKDAAEFFGVAPSVICVQFRANGVFFYYNDMKVERLNA